MRNRIWLDFETYSECDLKVHGSHIYIRDPSTQIICFSWAVGDKMPIELWTPDKPMPIQLFQALQEGGKLYAHNALFDWRIWNIIGTRDLGFPPIPLSSVVDTMAIGCSFSLPMSLDKAGEAMQIDNRKDKKGTQLIKVCCSPNKNGDQPTIWSNPSEFKAFFRYCIRDTEAMREMILKLPRQELIPVEQEVWVMTQNMNNIGLPIAYEEAKAILNVVEKYIKSRAPEITKLSKGAFQTINQRAKILTWCKQQGYTLPNLQAATVEAALKDLDIPKPVKDLLTLRQDLGKTSTAKFKKILNQASIDAHNRYWVHDNLKYHGAGPGRWTGAGFQMQNLPRASVKDPDQVVQDFIALNQGKLQDPKSLVITDPVGTAKALIRSMIKAPPGYLIMVADYNAVENRDLAWLACDETTIQGFIDGFDQYVDMAASRYGIPYEQIMAGHKAGDKEASFMRQMGKIIILGCIAKGTLLLTHLGPVPIENITLEHKLWDGEKFVTHKGLLDKGSKPCVFWNGFYLTKDHGIYFGNKKEEVWHHLGNTLSEKRAICLAFGKSLNIYRERIHLNATRVIESTAPCVGTNTFIFWRILRKLSLLNVIPADGVLNIDSVWTLIVNLQDLISQLLIDLSIDGLPPKLDAIILKLLNTNTTGDEVSPCVKNGYMMLEHFLTMLRPSLAMMTQVLNLTELTTMETMNPEISGSLPAVKTCLTHDILESGNLNRFTVLTPRGPVIVSNCGYGMGKDTFVKTALTWGVTITPEDAAEAVNAYREKYYLVKELWNGLKTAAVRAVISGKRQTYKRITFGTATVNGVRWLAMKLPSGKCVYYMDPQVSEMLIPKFEQMGPVPTITHMGTNPYTKKWTRLKLIPGRITENACQGTGREQMATGMLNVQKNMPQVTLIGTVHDEALALIAEQDYSEEVFTEFTNQLCSIPWAPDCPLKAEGYAGKRYKKG